MNRLGQTVKSIRERLGQSQVEFAQRLKVQQTTISRYESGKIVPNPFVLVQLHDLASSAEKRVFSEELGRQWEVIVAEGQRGVLQHIRDRVLPLLDDSLFMARVHNELQQMGAPKRPRGSDPVGEILALWAQYGVKRGALECFREAATYLRVRLSGLD